MRRFRLRIGGNIQPEIIDNHKTSLYQTTPKHTGKKQQTKNCVHEYLLNSLLLQSQDWIPNVWSYRSLFDAWSGHAVGRKCYQLRSSYNREFRRSRGWSQVLSALSNSQLSSKRFPSVLWIQESILWQIFRFWRHFIFCSKCCTKILTQKI